MPQFPAPHRQVLITELSHNSFSDRTPPKISRILHIRAVLTLLIVCLASLLLVGCGSGHSSSGVNLIVNSTDDILLAPTGTMTLRMAIEQAVSGDTITFDPSMSGRTVNLAIVGSYHTQLKGETYSGMTYQGYQYRDYGKTAIYVKKNLSIDASRLPGGITLQWNGGSANPARVMAVDGDLKMRNVTITGGHSLAETISAGTQPYTLARGGGLAVWGTADLQHCNIYGNKCTGDTNATRDRGTYGGGIYANGLRMEDCVVSGNSAIGYGAAGGGIYSVGGADNTGGKGNDTQLVRCSITGNRTTAQHSYGGGIFTLSGGPSNVATMTLTNCTIARNLVEDNPGLPQVMQYYYRGGGVYMGGGSLNITSCTIAENAVNGYAAIISGKPNMGGGGVASTIGNAHVVENVRLQHSIVAGNKMNGAAEDFFTGSLLGFYSGGYNLVGVLDCSQILVPVPDWADINRKHFPEVGDQEGVTMSQALLGAQTHSTIKSAGTDAGMPAVLYYDPSVMAMNQIPGRSYDIGYVRVGYTGYAKSSDDFINQVLLKLRTNYSSTLGSNFGSSFGDMTGVTWYETPSAWPSDPANAPWISFWHNLDTSLNGRLGMAGLGDDFWGSFHSGVLGDEMLTVKRDYSPIKLVNSDQLGSSRPNGGNGDIGAIEK